jgi:hypothetical protein
MERPMSTGVQALAALVHDSSDQRRHKRVDLRFKVRLYPLPRVHQVTADGHHVAAEDALQGSGFTENLSQGGLGLRWPREAAGVEAFHAGEPVVAEIQVPRAQVRLRCLGRIAWILDEDEQYVRAGVIFEAVNADELAALQSVLQES